MTTRTQKTTKVTDEERVAALGDIKAQIRMTDPNLSEREIERRALTAVGLPVGDDVDLDEIPKGGRPRAAARKVGEAAQRVRPIVTSTQSRRTIGGVLLLGLAIGIIRDFRSGDAIRTDVVPRRIIGSFIAAILLMVLAGPAPRVARGLAFLVGFTIVALNQDTISAIGGSVTNESVEREGGIAPSGDIGLPVEGPPEIRAGQPS